MAFKARLSARVPRCQKWNRTFFLHPQYYTHCSKWKTKRKFPVWSLSFLSEIRRKSTVTSKLFLKDVESHTLYFDSSAQSVQSYYSVHLFDSLFCVSILQGYPFSLILLLSPLTSDAVLMFMMMFYFQPLVIHKAYNTWNLPFNICGSKYS